MAAAFEENHEVSTVLALAVIYVGHKLSESLHENIINDMAAKQKINLEEKAKDGTQVTRHFPLTCDGKIIPHIEWTEKILRRSCVRGLILDSFDGFACTKPSSTDYLDPSASLVESQPTRRPGQKHIYYNAYTVPQIYIDHFKI